MIFSLVLMFGGTCFYFAAFNICITSYRRLVDYQFLHFHHIWEEDGRPIGGKITRSQVSFIGSDLFTAICGIKWAIKRPDWLTSESEGEKLRIRMLRWFFISLVGLFSAMGGIALFGVTLSKAS